MYLQTPVLSLFLLVGINIVVLFPNIVRRSTRIPNTKLTVFIFSKWSPVSQPANPEFALVHYTVLLTAKEDQIRSGIRMVRRTVHPILRHLSPRNDLHVPESLAQHSDLCSLLLFLRKYERILAQRAPGVPRLQQ